MTATPPPDSSGGTAGWFIDESEATPIFEQLLIETTTSQLAEEIIADAPVGGPAEDAPAEGRSQGAPASDSSGSDQGTHRAAIP